MRPAASSVSSRTFPASQSLLTTPQASASSAEKGRAARINSFARRSPTTRGSVCVPPPPGMMPSDTSVKRSEEHTSELQSQFHLVCRLLLEKKKKKKQNIHTQ